ncbi:polyprenal reductase isoform 2-T2 [Anomaloglossus baeobatrachus]|uniref:polyprenal reductase isoform X2 n=1 Tax=Anomaloglossus baeobatrachus TaxID=238106 RepID=UPI003F509485
MPGVVVQCQLCTVNSSTESCAIERWRGRGAGVNVEIPAALQMTDSAMLLLPGTGLSLVAGFWALLDVVFLLALFLHLIGDCSRRRAGLCSVFQDLIRYGKTKLRGRPAWLRYFDLPKRWFWHFYFLSVIWNGALLGLLVRSSLLGVQLPQWMQLLLNFFHKDSNQKVSVTVPGLLLQLRWYHIFGALLYIWASLHQNRCHMILAGLRKDKSGKVVTLHHVMPSGDWFENVSCPHYFAELLIYISIAFLFGLTHLTWWLQVLFVLFNQSLAAILCHEFYHQKFDSYPANRKAFIPFVF